MTALVDMPAVQMELGECPLWDHRHSRLYWVDIIRCTLFERDWASGVMRTWPLPALGGGLGLLGDDDLIVAAQTGLFRFSPQTGQYRFLLHPEPGIPSNRLNEGKTDDAGNFWIGSISTLGRQPEGALYRISAGGLVRQVLSGIHVPNALVFLPDKQLLFSDSHLKTIWRFQVKLDEGTLSDRQIFVDDHALPSIPDGAALAQDGTIWNAKFGGGRVVVYDQFAKIVGEVPLPVSQVTSCAFAGPELDYLVVTTAKRLLDDDQRRIQTEAGNLFIFKTDVSGRREPVCRL